MNPLPTNHRRLPSSAMILGLLLSGMFAASASGAEPKMKDWFIQIVAPKVTSVAVNDKAGILVVAQAGVKDQHLSVYKLNSKGEPAEDKVQLIKLPRPQSLNKFENYPGSVVFHPSLPVVYAWQDISGPEKDSPEAKVASNDFSHLIVFAITNTTLQQVGAFAHGAEFVYGQSSVAGNMAVDKEGSRLFVPNLQGGHGIGYYDLDDKGMPKPVPVPIKGTLDGYGLNKFEMKVRPVKTDVQFSRSLPTGWGFVAPSKRAVLFGSSQGLSVWDTENRLAPLGRFVIPACPVNCLLGGEPGRNVVYGIGHDRNIVFRMEHADGFPTLLPQIKYISNAKFQSIPIVITDRQKKLAVGGVNFVYLLSLDKQGRFTDATENVTVTGMIRSLAYSMKYRRLYVPVEKKQ